MRTRYIAGNWKMNQTKADIDAFIAGIKDLSNHDCQTWIAPQFVHIPYLLEKAKEFPTLKVGAQNCSAELKGAFTGDISLTALKDVGAEFVIIGHSERRSIFHEDHELLNKKMKLAQNEGMTTIFCIGETLEEREAGNTNAVVEEQLLKGLAGVSDKNLIIAYEPVWAIGTGKTATPEQAEEVHAFVRTILKEKLDLNADDISILYGGSVKPGNVAELLSMPNIDGGLVGGASLKAEDFKALCLNR